MGRTVQGGGIGASGENVGIGLLNSTVSGNRGRSRHLGSPGTGGGIIQLPTSLGSCSSHATIAGNEAAAGVALSSPRHRQHADQRPDEQLLILAGNTGGACRPARLANMTTHHNLVQDSTCALGGARRHPRHRRAARHPGQQRRAYRHARASGGQPGHQHGRHVRRAPISGASPGRAAACDIGAFEYVAPTLTVTTSVINDNGGTATSVTYRVTRNGADVAGSPASGNATTRSSQARSTSRTRSPGYTLRFGGDCSPTGDVVLGENQNKTCTVVANDNALSGSQLPPPVIREKVNMIPARGTIKVKRPGAKRFRKLADNGAQLPVGTTVDALDGRVTIVAASDDGGGTDTAVFYGGIFKIGQTKGDKPTTILSLTEKLSCPKAGTAIAAAKKKKRRLWGDGEGKFRTKGKHSAATVVGTKWLVEDRCTSTLTRVIRGRVSVRDFAKKKTVIVRAGKKYTARAG